MIDSWVQDRTVYERLRDNFLQLRYDEDPTLVVTELIDLAQEVSGTQLQPGPFPPKPRKGR